MNPQHHDELAAGVARQRIGALYNRLPSSIASVLVGVLLVFVFLMSSTSPELLKAWAAYMLTALGIRGWIWQQFRAAVVPIETLPRWEYAYAFGMALSAFGWALLCGPMFPTQPGLQNFAWVLVIFVAFSGMVLATPSRITFLVFIVPTLLPALYRFFEISGGDLPAMVASAACTAVMLITHHNLHTFTIDHLRRQVQAEQLLAEQQAIFQGATVGIAIFENSVLIKCNKRFAELFGRNFSAMQDAHAIDFFAQPDEGTRFLTWAASELDAGRTAHSMERLRRADGSQFWAEISGRQLRYGEHVRVLWLITDATGRQER